MPKRKQEKQPHEMTTEELAKKVFPPAVLERLKAIANPPEQPKKSSQKEST